MTLLTETPLSGILLKMALISLNWQLYFINWFLMRIQLELYLYLVDEGQPAMSYSLVALGSVPLRRKRRTFSV